MRSRTSRRAAVLACAAGLLLGTAPAPTPLYPAVTSARLINAAADDGWLMYRRSYDAQGYAPFDEISPANVARLKIAYTYDTGFVQGHESPAIVNGRTLIVTTPLANVVALDAVTGAVRWKYEHDFDTRALRTVCCDVVNRGVALAGENVYVGTLDDRLVALDGRTGAVRWQRSLATPGHGYAVTGAPLVVGDAVISGVAGGEYGAPGFIAAFDARSGAPRWKTATLPAANSPAGRTWPRGALAHGGGSTWLTGSYDPTTATLYWGVGNPGPWRADLRPGRNLDTDSVLALDPRSGARKWAFQYTPGDSWDYDGVNESVLIAAGEGLPPLLVHADRNGQLVALDSRSGRLAWSTPFVKSTAVRGYRADGTAIVDPAAYPHVGHDAFVCPSSAGGKNWYPTAYDPATHLLFVPTLHLCMTVAATKLDPGDIVRGYFGERTTLVAEPGHPDLGELQAFDVRSGRRAWSYPSPDPWTGGVLTTAGGLVFSAAGRTFMAFEAASGRLVWSAELSSGIIGVPTSYRVDGKQYVAVYAGWGGGLALFGGPSAERGARYPRGGRLYVFTL